VVAQVVAEVLAEVVSYRAELLRRRGGAGRSAGLVRAGLGTLRAARVGPIQSVHHPTAAAHSSRALAYAG